MKQKIVIIGAGGHGKVVADTIVAQDKYELIGFVDAVLPIGEKIINDFCVVETQDNIKLLKNKADVFIVAVGNNVVREKIYNLVIEILSPSIVIHPSSVIGSDVTIDSGTVVLANTVINASSHIGKNTIVNTGTVVDHDCVIGDSIHLSIGTMVGSNSIIENGHTTSIGESIPSFSKLPM